MNRKWFYLIAALLVFLPIFLNAARGEEIPSPRIPSGKVLNEHVKSRVRTKYARICEAILVESKKHGFDPLIVAAIIETESRFRTRLRGRYGEIGLMQVKPSTAKWIAKKIRMPWSGPQMLENPTVNIRIGTAYLSFLREEFPKDKQLYLSAYNMGAANVRRAMKKQLVPRIYAGKVFKHYEQLQHSIL